MRWRSDNSEVRRDDGRLDAVLLQSVVVSRVWSCCLFGLPMGLLSLGKALSHKSSGHTGKH